MAVTDEYREGIQELGTTLTGNTAPKTGYYYRQIYSAADTQTGVPTLTVELQQAQTGSVNGGQYATTEPVSNLTDAQILKMIQNGQQVTTNNSLQSNTTREYVTNEAIQITEATSSEATSNVPFIGIATLILLLIFVGFVYFIIRIWQDHSAQTRVMTSLKEHDTDVVTPVLKKAESANKPSDWHTEISLADDKLRSLLEGKGIAGATISDKLKLVGAGQFASVDIAWEAHQSAKDLLKKHSDEVDMNSVKRTLQLFKQVFADHHVI